MPISPTLVSLAPQRLPPRQIHRQQMAKKQYYYATGISSNFSPMARNVIPSLSRYVLPRQSLVAVRNNLWASKRVAPASSALADEMSRKNPTWKIASKVKSFPTTSGIGIPLSVISKLRTAVPDTNVKIAIPESP